MTERALCFWNNKQSDTPPGLKRGDKEIAAIVGWGGIQVADPDIDIVDLCCEYARAVRNNSCGQCIPCRVGTRALADIFERLAAREGARGDLETIRILAETISQASLCEIGRSSPKVFLYLLDNYSDLFKSALNGKAPDGQRKRKGGTKRYTYRSVTTAPCMQACPMHLDIPKYVEAIKFGRFRESLDIIRRKLPLPGVVGRVCVRPCEFNCRRGLIDEPIQIKHLKRFVADYVRDETSLPPAATLQEQAYREIALIPGPQPERSEPKGDKVAIVGAGPSGLTCAHFLARKGYEVTIYELLSEPGGMAAVGIPDYRLPRHILRDEVAAIEELGVKIVYGQGLGTHFTLDDLDREGYKAIFIGMGCHCHKSMGIEGEDKGYYGYIPGVYFLRNVNLGLDDELPKGKRMVVVGGGNVAIDCVRTAFRVGFDESHIVYRRSRKEMPADAVEVDDAEAEGVQFHFLTAPKRIIGEQGKVVGLECLRMELGEPDASGRRRPVEVPGSEFIIPADVVVAAIGQEGDFSCMCNLPGVEVTSKGALVVDEHLMTTRRGVFAGGDCITGPDVLIRACAHGRSAAFKIDALLRGESVAPLEEELDEAFLTPLRVYTPSEQVGIPGGLPRMPIPHEPPPERKRDFREADKGFSAAEAMAEAQRCLRCYRVVTYAYKQVQ